MKRTANIASRPGDAGFTLLELIAVLAIVALAAMLAFPVAERSRRGPSVRTAAIDLASALKVARAEAVRSNTDSKLVLDLPGRRFGADGYGRPHALPREVTVSYDVPLGEQSGDGVAALPLSSRWQLQRRQGHSFRTWADRQHQCRLADRPHARRLGALMAKDRQAGFTLLETVVALMVFALVAGALQLCLAGGWKGVRSVRMEQAALIVAKAQLATAGVESSLVDGTEEGTTEAGFHWTRDIRRYEPARRRRDGGNSWLLGQSHSELARFSDAPREVCRAQNPQAREGWMKLRQQFKRGFHRRDAGFTLIELLVSLAVLALAMVIIPSTLRLAARASATSVELIEGSDSSTAASFIERSLSEAMPVLQRDGEGKLTIAFSGEAQSVQFVAPLANGPAGGGIYRIGLFVEPDGAERGTVIVLRLYSHERNRSGPDAEKPLEERRLGRAAGELRYFGVPAGKTVAEWSSTWTRTDRLPDLVEVFLAPPGVDVPAAPLKVELKLRSRT